MAEKMEVTPLTLTEDGLRLQAKVQTGLTKLNLVKVIIGYGFLDGTESPLRITDVKNEIPSRQTGDSGSAPTVDLTRKFQDDEEAMSLITVTVQNGDNDFTYCREFLFLALDSTTDEIIKYAYANLGENGLPLPKYNGKSHVAYNIDFPTAITNADDVEIHTTLVSGTPWDEFMNHVNNTDNPHTIEFMEAETLLNITSGERLSLIFGKIKKAIASLISHLADESNPHNVTVEQIGAIPISAKGSAGGVAELDESGTVPSSQLPSYVDDVIECNGISAFPTTGESGKIYVDILTNLSYRWSGSQYTEISKSLAIGTTSSTAFAGDKGQTAYEHSQQPHAPSNANYYVHPSSHSASMIDETTSRKFVTADQKAKLDGIETGAQKHKAPTSAEITSALGYTPSNGEIYPYEVTSYSASGRNISNVVGRTVLLKNVDTDNALNYISYNDDVGFTLTKTIPIGATALGKIRTTWVSTVDENTNGSIEILYVTSSDASITLWENFEDGLYCADENYDGDLQDILRIFSSLPRINISGEQYVDNDVFFTQGNMFILKNSGAATNKILLDTGDQGTDWKCTLKKSIGRGELKLCQVLSPAINGKPDANTDGTIAVLN